MGGSVRLDGDFSPEKVSRLKDWIQYYRKNPHRFVKEYFGINLYLYQKIWLYLMWHSNRFVALASRASAKSWLVSVYILAKCVLYPSTEVVIAAATKRQASLIVSSKIQMLYDEFPIVRKEISDITTNLNKVEVRFYNGSIVRATTSNENARGLRATVLIIDERAIADEEVLQSVLKPMLYSRRPPYTKKKEYEGLVEEPVEIHISSVRFKGEPWYQEVMKWLRKVAEGDPSYGAIFLDYLITLKHGIKTFSQMKTEKDTNDPISFSQEYCNIPWGSSSRSYYKVEFFDRKIKRPWRPWTKEFGKLSNNPYSIKRQDGEIRVMAVDVATRAGSSNDATIMSLARLLPTKAGYRTDVVYIESHEGVNTLKQVLRIKQLFFEFCAPEIGDVLVLDIKNSGIGIYDALTGITEDSDRDVEYLPIKIIENPQRIAKDIVEDLNDRAISPDAIPCVYPMVASASLNSSIASTFRTRLKDGLLNFIVVETRLEEYLIARKNKDVMDSAMRAYLLSPAVETTFMINECVSLEMSLTGGGENIKLEEQSTGRKDRFSSVSYLNWYVSLLELELLKEEDETDDFEEFSSMMMVLN